MKKGLVIFTPMPPVQNGIADYAHRLIVEHAKIYDCVVVIANEAPMPTVPSSVVVIREHEYHGMGKAFRAFTHMFHVGNNPDHGYMLDTLSRVSGIVVLHDLTLHHLVSSAHYYGVRDQGHHARLIRDDHGYAGGLLADQDHRWRWRSNSNYFELPVLGAVLRHACAVIVHSWMGVLRVQAYRPDISIKHIEHFADIPKEGRTARRLAARARLGIPEHTNLVLSLGFITVAKQVEATIRAIAHIQNEVPHLLYIAVGEARELSVCEEAEKHDISHLVRHIGYSHEQKISDCLDAADILVNLRYPTGGETSGSLSRALGRGVCAIVSDHGWYGELPDDVVVKIPACADPAIMLAGSLLMLIKDRQKRHHYEVAAALWASGRIDLDTVIKDYHSVIDKAVARPLQGQEKDRPIALPCAPNLNDLDRLLAKGQSAIGDVKSPQFLGRLWLLEGLVPLPEPGGALRLGGPRGLSRIIEQLTGWRSFLEPGKKAYRGVFVGSWREAVENGAHLGDFCADFVNDGIAAFNFWSEEEEESIPNAERVEHLLANLNFEILHCVSKSAIALTMLSNFPPVLEIAVIARRLSPHERS